MKDEILEKLFIGGIILAGILVIATIASFGFSIGDNYYTGYIYSADTEIEILEDTNETTQ